MRTCRIFDCFDEYGEDGMLEYGGQIQGGRGVLTYRSPFQTPIYLLCLTPAGSRFGMAAWLGLAFATAPCHW